jgi:hypothetical protein
MDSTRRKLFHFSLMCDLRIIVVTAEELGNSRWAARV